MKNLFFIIVCLCFFSCGSILPTNKLLDKPYVVYNIEGIGNEYLCKYHINTSTTYTYYITDICVIDSIGKHSIGDKLYLSLNKIK